MAAIAVHLLFTASASIAAHRVNAGNRAASRPSQTLGDLQPSQRSPLGGGDSTPAPESETRRRFKSTSARGQGSTPRGGPCAPDDLFMVARGFLLRPQRGYPRGELEAGSSKCPLPSEGVMLIPGDFLLHSHRRGKADRHLHRAGVTRGRLATDAGQRMALQRRRALHVLGPQLG